MSRLKRLILAVLLLVTVATFGLAQRRQRGPDSVFESSGQVPTAREAIGDASDYPKWEYEPRFRKDVFTFVRIEYDVDLEHPGHAGNERWTIDFPDSDLN